MSDSMNIALSGLQANATRFATAANNIANVRSTSSADTPEEAYQPQQTSTLSVETGGVTTITETQNPSTYTAYSPTDPNANADGMVAMPNVNIDAEMVESMMAVTGYKANASAIRTLQAMDRSLLDIKA